MPTEQFPVPPWAGHQRRTCPNQIHPPASISAEALPISPHYRQEYGGVKSRITTLTVTAPREDARLAARRTIPGQTEESLTGRSSAGLFPEGLWKKAMRSATSWSQMTARSPLTRPYQASGWRGLRDDGVARVVC
jgi:hypothetical protein